MILEFLHLFSCNGSAMIYWRRDIMPLKYKMDVLESLKAAGYNTTRIRREGLFSQSTLQKLRTGGQLSWSNIEMICKLLDCQPGDLLEYTSE